MGGAINDIGWGYFDFEKGGHFSQSAKATGWAGNIGFTYKVSPQLTIGGIYHAKTSLSDMVTDSNGATVKFNVNSLGGVPGMLAPGQNTLTVTGKVTIRNFQWPETYGFGFAYQANDQWMVTADYKHIGWAATMRNLDMKFEGSLLGMDMSMNLLYKQDWKDQDVIQLGAAYKYSDALTLRFGANLGNNPIPDQTVSALFPAIMKDHYSAGFGYAFDKASSIDGAIVYAPKVNVTNNWSAASSLAGGTTSNQNISLGTDLSYQIMYSHRF
jgi:long-chain fatty acid transport protein